jgi:hypothetical protein
MSRRDYSEGKEGTQGQRCNKYRENADFYEAVWKSWLFMRLFALPQRKIQELVISFAATNIESYFTEVFRR